MKRIVLAGGSGFLGSELAKHFRALHWEVVVLTRTPKQRPDSGREVAWDAATLGAWQNELDGATAVVNLTGRSVDCRYNEKNRRDIMNSRVNSTRVVGEAIAQCKTPPRVWLNSSTATVYTHTFGKPHDESSQDMDSAADAKDAFSVQVAQAWERELFAAKLPLTPTLSPPDGARELTRRVALRTSMVLGLGRNSVFPVLRRLTRLGLGGRQGSGNQFVSWIHVEDFCRAIEWIINHEDLSGPINQCAPNPLPNKEMMKTFREVCGMPIGLPANEWMLEIGAFFLRTETELIFKSRRVVPGRLLASGFEFRFPTFREALEDLEKKLAG
ncbi:MAG TPA: TIGR01777 family oxidoreductase [Verrucomicrobiae bacterium]|nr:TIGR01777 family oxidoreductase [Verrucomicrobiae bacterium]